MRKVLTLATLLILFTSNLFGQLNTSELLRTVRRVKLLESTRFEVKQIFYRYQASDDDGYNQTFSNDDVDIEIVYSSGSCSDDPDDEDESDVWKVAEWTVTRIEIDWNEPVSLEEIGIDLSKLKKEQTYRDNPDRNMYHDKAKGIAIELGEDGVERIVFFPPRDRSKKLCSDSTSTREFYSRKSWFSQKLEDRSGETYCPVPGVNDLQLSSTEIVATGAKSIVVTTIASDPENDVLTYGYKVSGGHIIGNGPRVTWDLTGVAAGTYSITAAVDDGCGFCGPTMTKTVNVK